MKKNFPTDFFTQRVLSAFCFVFLMQSVYAEQVTTRVIEFEYDATTGLLKKEVVEPYDPLLKIQTDYSYDLVGNQQEVKKTALDQNPSAFKSPTLVLRGRTATTLYVPSEPRYPFSKTNALGHEERFEFDARWGLRSKYISPNAETQDSAYDVYGRLLSETNRSSVLSAAMISKIYSYDRNIGTTSFSGNASVARSCVVTSSTGSVGVTSSLPQECIYLNAVNQVVATTKALVEQKGGPIKLSLVWHQYDAIGKKTSTSLPFWEGQSNTAAKTTFTYDSLGRSSTQTAPNLGVTSFQYGPNWTQTTDAKSRSKKTVLNLHGKPAQIIDAKGGSLYYRYDAVGNLKNIYDHYGSTTSISHDNRGNKIGLVDPHKGAWSYTLNGFGEIISQQDAKGQVSYQQYDDLGRLTKREYAPTKNQNQSFVPNSGEHVGVWIYDVCKKGLLCETNNGSVGFKKSNVYNEWSRIKATLTEHGNNSNDPKFLEAYEYDDFGRIREKISPKTNLSNANDLHRLVTRYDYDQGGQPKSVKISSLLTSANPETIWEKLQVDASGRLVEESLHGKAVKSQFDNEMGWLKARTVGANAEDYSSEYRWDLVGNLSERTFNKSALPTHPIIKDNFGYDELDRLSSFVSSMGVANVSLEYLANGNIHYKSDTGFYDYGNNGSTPQKPSQLKLISYQGRSYDSYDLNGNLLQVKDIGSGNLRKEFKYTAFDQTYSVTVVGGDTASNGVSEFKFGPDLQRIYSKLPDGLNSAIETNYVNGDDSLGLNMERVKRTSAGSTTVIYRHYINLAGVTIAQIDVPENVDPASLSPIQGLDRRYLVQDPVGSSSLIINHSGVVGERLYYDPWGRRRSALTGQYESELSTSQSHLSSRGYTMHEHLPSMGLVHMNGRLYDPMLGRFIQADSYVQTPDDLQSFNRYAYVNNNPLRYSDPTGHFLYDSYNNSINNYQPTFGFTYTSPGSSSLSSFGSTPSYESGFSSFARPLDLSIGATSSSQGIGSVSNNSAYSNYVNGFGSDLSMLGISNQSLSLANTFGSSSNQSSTFGNNSGYLFSQNAPDLRQHSMVDATGAPLGGNPIGGDAVRMVGYGTLALTAGVGGLVLADGIAGGAAVLDAVSVSRSFSQLSKDALKELYNPEALKSLFKRGEIASTLTREGLLAYKEIATRTLVDYYQKNKTLGIETQTDRLRQIYEALRSIR